MWNEDPESVLAISRLGVGTAIAAVTLVALPVALLGSAASLGAFELYKPSESHNSEQLQRWEHLSDMEMEFIYK